MCLCFSFCPSSMIQYIVIFTIQKFQPSVLPTKEEYVQRGTDQTGHLDVQASKDSYVVAQMVDKAVHILNDNTNLTPRKVSFTFINPSTKPLHYSLLCVRVQQLNKIYSRSISYPILVEIHPCHITLESLGPKFQDYILGLYYYVCVCVFIPPLLYIVFRLASYVQYYTATSYISWIYPQLYIMDTPSI